MNNGIASPTGRRRRVSVCWSLVCIALVMLTGSMKLHAHRNGHGAEHAAPAVAPAGATASELIATLQSFRVGGEPSALDRAEILAARLLTAAPNDLRARYLAARVAQAAHEFTAALEHLQVVLYARPADGPANALAASILTLQGQGGQALAHCRQARIDWLERAACRLRARQVMDDSPGERDLGRFERLLAALPNGVAPRQRAWLFATAGDLAAQLNLWPRALKHYQSAQALEPATRHQAALAEALLQLRRPDDVLALIGAGTTAFGLRVKRARATRALGQSTDSALESEVSALLRLGDLAHARELGEYLLYVAEDAVRAEQILRAGMSLQREVADVRLLREAASRLAGLSHTLPEFIGAN
ncbi:MAG: hypothetical protein AAF515_13000 [Pseudomonadota bacterium]